MKKLFLTLTLALLTFTAAYAQFGIIGGFTSSSTKLPKGTNWSAEVKNAPLWHAGVAYKIGLGIEVEAASFRTEIVAMSCGLRYDRLSIGTPSTT